jgi:hypothetical protein
MSSVRATGSSRAAARHAICLPACVLPARLPCPAASETAEGGSASHMFTEVPLADPAAAGSLTCYVAPLLHCMRIDHSRTFLQVLPAVPSCSIYLRVFDISSVHAAPACQCGPAPPPPHPRLPPVQLFHGISVSTCRCRRAPSAPMAAAVFWHPSQGWARRPASSPRS